jgi:hypothetical protein
MRNGRLVNRTMLACAAVLVFFLASGCGSGERVQSPDRGVWFIHATDPHVFLEPAKSPDDEKKFPRDRQQSLNELAMSDMWSQILSIASDAHRLSFVVLTGDFGVDPCSIASKDEKGNSPTGTQCLDTKRIDDGARSKQVEKLAALLGQSSISDVYLVAGNNDIPSEMADDAGLVYFNQFIDDVQRKIDENKKSVHLHNLTRCYVKDGIASTCYADVLDTSYRLIGFPSYSFKNRDTSRQTNTAAQEKQFEIFRALLDQARQAGKMVVVVTHIPLIDDPYTMARDFYGTPIAIDRDPDNPQSKWSTWNVSKKLSDEWEEAIASDSVAGVLAGHLHDSHKEIYRAPYTWSKVNDPKNGFGKLYMAPPLALKNQETSPIQARGFAPVGLDRDRITHLIYWYNSEAHNFVPERRPEDEWQRSRRGRLARGIHWLWVLSNPQKPLEQMAVLMIAFLAAFLTVVQIWQIPPPDNPLAKQTDSPANGGGSAAGGAKTNDTKPAFIPSPFASNFGQTVIAGLGGLAAETVLKAWEGKPSGSDKEFYIVWFILFFFAMLLGLALFRAVVEGMRARVAIIYYPLAWSPRRHIGLWGRRWDWFTYWIRRAVQWIASLRVPALTFLDTFLNLIRGKNQTMTQVFSDKIIEQQRNVVRVAGILSGQINGVILNRLLALRAEEELPQQMPNPEDVRVNVSVLSADQTNVFYIVRTPGSSVKAFPKRSVAWVSVYTGKIRWYMRSYFKNTDLYKEILLFNNDDETIKGDEKQIHLNSHYQPRDDDYEAFVMFPVPWPQRAFGSDYVKGAIHISFRRQEDFERIWDFLNPVERAAVQAAREWAAAKVDQAIQAATTGEERLQLQQQRQAAIHATAAAAVAAAIATGAKIGDPVLKHSHTYKYEEQMLEDWCTDPQVQATLREAVAALGELLHGFNENIYNSSGGSQTR